MFLEAFDVSSVDLPEDVAWAYTNFGNKRARQSESPSPGAFQLLQWARSNSSKFFSMVMTEQIKREKDSRDVESEKDAMTQKDLLDEFDKVLEDIRNDPNAQPIRHQLIESIHQTVNGWRTMNGEQMAHVLKTVQSLTRPPMEEVA